MLGCNDAWQNRKAVKYIGSDRSCENVVRKTPMRARLDLDAIVNDVVTHGRNTNCPGPNLPRDNGEGSPASEEPANGPVFPAPVPESACRPKDQRSTAHAEQKQRNPRPSPTECVRQPGETHCQRERKAEEPLGADEQARKSLARWTGVSVGKEMISSAKLNEKKPPRGDHASTRSTAHERGRCPVSPRAKHDARARSLHGPCAGYHQPPADQIRACGKALHAVRAERQN
jgi:hypothetical protein